MTAILTGAATGRRELLRGTLRQGALRQGTLPQGELAAIAAPVLKEITEHPFWAGLRTGTLPPESLWYFAEQDARHVVPTYARALARCAAVADRDAHATLLCSAAQATFGSLSRLDSELARLGADLDRSAAAAPGAPGPSVHGYASFMLAAPADSFAAGAGGLLPMTWFHLHVSNDLRRRHEPGSRYAAWIDQYCAYDGFEEYVAAYLRMVDQVAADGSAGDWDQLVERFLTGAHFELAFADAAWRREEWPG